MTSVGAVVDATVERRLSQRLREAALEAIESRSLQDDDLASLLGMSRTAVYTISLRDSWPLVLALRVVEGLGLRVDLTISEANEGRASHQKQSEV